MKHKIGDRLIVKEVFSGGNFKEGDIVPVIGIGFEDDLDCYAAISPYDGKVWYLREGEVELAGMEESKVNYRELWEPCKYCKEQFDPCLEDNCFRKNKDKCFYNCEKSQKYYKYRTLIEESQFCPKCGRPLTEEAWKKIEDIWRELGIRQKAMKY